MQTTRKKKLALRSILISFLLLFLSTSFLFNVFFIYFDKKIFLPVLKKNFKDFNSSIIFDILSISSKNQLELLKLQKQVFEKQAEVRNFFYVTEDDDTDPTCHKNLTWSDVINISKFCRKRKHLNITKFERTLKGNFAYIKWLEKKKNPIGWICAQKRPIVGLKKVFESYKNHSEKLPDYLIIVDDDTYINLKAIKIDLQALDAKNSRYLAGCMSRFPLHEINFTFPYGGFGSFLSKTSIQRFQERINCRKEEYSQICKRIDENIVREKQFFKNNMSVFDLMFEFVRTEEYVNIRSWRKGFCMHSVSFVWRNYISFQYQQFLIFSF